MFNAEKWRLARRALEVRDRLHAVRKDAPDIYDARELAAIVAELAVALYNLETGDNAEATE